MAQSIDRTAIETLMELSRIACSEEEIDQLSKNLAKILGYVAQLQEIDTSDLPPCSYVIEGMSSPLREDEVGNTLDREEFLRNSPSHIGGMIRVPTVIKQG